ncbi:MerR family transcriptional regulator, partial [candidate division TA06 bacterium]|nr:MerR family transcriptional regulator [candidate division TA06 bacterium]
AGISVHTVKYYLKIGLFHEAGRSPETNFRYFDDRILKQLHHICALRREGKNIREIQSLLREGP